MKRVALLLAAVLVVPVTTGGAAHAQSSDEARQDEIQATIDAVREELDEVAAEEADLLGELRVTQARRAEEDGRLHALDQEMTTVLAELEVAQSKLDIAIAAELEAQRRMTAAHDDLQAARSAFSDQAVSAYMHSSRFEVPTGMAMPDLIGDLRSARALVDALNDKQAALIEDLQALEDDTAALQHEAQQARDAAAAVRNEVESRTAALEAARTAQADSRAKVAAEAANEERLLSAVRGERQAYERRIRELQAESDSIADMLRRRGSGGVGCNGSGCMSSPLAVTVITSSFGYRIHPIYGDRRLHAGIDLRATSGTPIYAAAPGEVVYAGWRGGYGNCVIVDHG
ncbi:MAG TPA: peptidoglycan DD-metalloendopeptidase family protein, partial [Acidimicrobiales bacterium]|nr:peptidoglycan DD-metalloendopeptidase family protein [Acidimicrobiales bacterium]